jgi:hypothetical protein
MKLDDVFDVEPVDNKITVRQVTTVRDDMIEYDYQSARSNLYSVLQQGEDALLHALEVAKSKEEPRAFEVVGGLLKNLADINTQLLDIAERKQKLLEKEKKELPTQQITNNNAIFVGSTDELNKMISKMKGE